MKAMIIVSWKKRTKFVILRRIVFCSIILVLLGILFLLLLLLPGHVDRLLLTDTHHCCLGNTASGRRVSVNGLNDSVSIKRETVGRRGLLQRAVDLLIWNVVLISHKNESSYDDDCPVTKKIKTSSDLESAFSCQELHPICREYRMLRTRLRVEKLILPWNWYYRNVAVELRGLSLHAFTEDIRFIQKRDTILMIDSDALLRNAFGSHDVSQIGVSSTSKETATLRVEYASFSFQSWRYPVVSVQLNEITINIIIQLDENRFDDKVLVGDMKIPELLSILPKPLEQEGLYPRIGVVNITNVTLNIYEGGGSSDSSLKLLLQATLPDELFSPVTNLTLTNAPHGIDRKHFQPLLGSAFSNSIRQHLVLEAERAFHNSLTTTTEWTKQLREVTSRVQEQLHQYLLKRQDMHFDQLWEVIWTGMMNGSVPILIAVGAWIDDLRQAPSLALLVSHHWNNFLSEANKNVVSIDQHIWRHVSDLEVAFDGLVAKTAGKDIDIEKYSVPVEKRIANRLDKLKESFDEMIAKSGGNLERLLQSCEDEVRDKWMSWHLQFFPEI